MAIGSVIGNLRVNLGLDSTQYQSGMRQAVTQAQGLRAVMPPLAAGIRGVGAAMRAAMAMTGIGGIIAGVSILVGKFIDLLRETRSWGDAFTIVKGIALDVWDRVKLGAMAMVESVKAGIAGIQVAWFSALRNMATSASNMFYTFAEDNPDSPFAGMARRFTAQAERAAASLNNGPLRDAVDSMTDHMNEAGNLWGQAFALTGKANDVGGSSGGTAAAVSAINDVKSATEDLDKAAKAGASTMADVFMGMVDRSKSLKQSLGELAAQMAKTFAQKGFAQLATSGVGGGIFSAFGSLIGANANGTTSWRGGLTQINERGGEIIDLPSGTRIIPHDVSNRMADRAGASAPSISIGHEIDGAGNLRTLVRDEVGALLAEQTQPIIGRAVQASARASRRTKQVMGI